MVMSLTMTWYSRNVIVTGSNWFKELLLHGPGLGSIDGSVFIWKDIMVNDATINNNGISWG